MTTTQKIHWPAEWEKHQATWMAFPCRTVIWENGLEKAHQAFGKVANQISEHEPLKMLVTSAQLASAKKLLSSNIALIETQLDDSWTRDTAPIWIKQDGVLKGLDFDFNAWGNKFSPYSHDQAVAQFICEHAQIERIPHQMVLEGGSIHSNGAGILLTTKECLLNPNRNPNISQSEIEHELKQHLGVHQIIWLDNGVVGDVDTDGHIDNIACFVDNKTIVTQSCGEESENFSIYQANKSVIKNYGLNLVEIPEPSSRYTAGVRDPLSYINFYIANNCVIVPQFGCPQDIAARETLKELFPDRTICCVDANEILVGGGGIHCITMQQPA